MTALRWVASDVHRLHDPQHETGRACRTGTWRRRLARSRSGWRWTTRRRGSASRRPSTGSRPSRRCTTRGLVAYLATAWDEWLAARPDVTELIPDTVLHPALREGMGALPPQASLEGRLGQWCFETMTPIMAGTYRAAREAVDIALTAVDLVLDDAGEEAPTGRRPVAWPMDCAGRPATMRRVPRSVATATSTTPPSPPSRSRAGPVDAWRSWTSTSITATAPSRSSTPGRTCSTSRSTATRIGCTRTSWATRRRSAPARVPART